MKYQTINAGDHFGRLETLERIKIGRRIAWICKCSCGNTRAVLSQNLNNGTTKSCGCYNREAASQRIREINFKHGRTPLIYINNLTIKYRILPHLYQQI